MGFNIRPRDSIKYTDDEIVEFIIENGSHTVYKFLQYDKPIGVLAFDALEKLIDLARIENCPVLDLSKIEIKKVPESIGSLTNLRVLRLGIKYSLYSNQFNELPDSITNLRNLSVFIIHDSKIKRLPENFSEMTSLVSLSLTDCRFEYFPAQLLDLKNLKKLSIGFNQIIELPDEIHKLQRLERLNISDLPIYSIPDGLGRLTKLKTLILRNTHINKLPASLSNLKKLEKFDIGGTPLAENLPAEILSQSPLEVIDYIIKSQSNEKKTILRESKMIIVGQGGVGKTCLLNLLVKGEYSEKPSTEGIDISRWVFDEVKESTLNIWDFGGQEIYHATHQFFLTKRSLYIFVWDSRQEDEYGRIDYWLKTVEAFAGDCPIIIVVNKCDKDRKNYKELDMSAFKSRYPQIVDAFYVSCKDNVGIAELRQTIIETASNLPLMNTEWFSSWLKVRKILEDMSHKANYIPYSEYQKICKKQRIKEIEALSLIKYLHDLGVVLHFHDDSLLKDVVILSPEWGTDAVYKILDAKLTVLKNRSGILYYNDLPKIWSDKKYIPQTYPYLLRLMANFELSFVIKELNVYLVAELLENEAKDLGLNFSKKESLNFNYYYDFLPAGIITRFIVKAHEYLKEKAEVKQCWLKGAYLEYGDSYAKIQLFDGITERYVCINVGGPNRRTRSELMQIIRVQFDAIHKSIPKIVITPKISCICSEECTFLHEYDFLLKLEQKQKPITVCQCSVEDVDVLQLLDGFQFRKWKDSEGMKIEVNPIINVNATSNANSSSISENNVTIEITNNINELQGLLNELKDDITSVLPDYKADYEKIQDAVSRLESIETKDEFVKSGLLNKIKRFIEQSADSDSDVGKVIQKMKTGYSILQDIAEKYNSIAVWCGLPSVPNLFLKGR